MLHAQKPDLVFQRNGRVHLYRRGCQFSRLLAAEVCASAVVMLDRPCSHTVHYCWLPTPFASFPFTSPPVLRRVQSDSVSTLLLSYFSFRCSFKLYSMTDRLNGQTLERAVIYPWRSFFFPPGQLCVEFPKVLHLTVSLSNYWRLSTEKDRLCGLVVRVFGYRYRGPGFDPRRYQIF